MILNMIITMHKRQAGRFSDMLPKVGAFSYANIEMFCTHFVDKSVRKTLPAAPSPCFN